MLSKRTHSATQIGYSSFKCVFTGKDFLRYRGHIFGQIRNGFGMKLPYVNVIDLWGSIFYTPVIGTYYGMAWIVRPSVRVSVCLSVHFLLVRAITLIRST
jgi:hypothetical protein